MKQRGVHKMHSGWGGQSLYYQSLCPPHRCQESDPDTVAAPLAQRQRVGEYWARIPFTFDEEGRRRPKVQAPARHKGQILVEKKCSMRG